MRVEEGGMGGEGQTRRSERQKDAGVGEARKEGRKRKDRKEEAEAVKRILRKWR